MNKKLGLLLVALAFTTNALPMGRSDSLVAKYPLHDAARLGKLDTLQKLLNSNVYDINQADDRDLTPLHAAALNNHPTCVAELIKHGANKDALATDNGYTPLHLAAQSSHYASAEILVKNGADITLGVQSGTFKDYTAKDLANFKRNHPLLDLLEAQETEIIIDHEAKEEIPSASINQTTEEHLETQTQSAGTSYDWSCIIT
ncbi:ankyrin repeat domain-containing protein [bacterium]|nr:MAG: ankyrin repeat domain-containing protein [bacterium]